jgi:hypothetical protein
MKHEDKVKQQRALLASLMTELFQSERSALVHPRREADRLGSAPPAQAMRAVSEHAGRMGDDLRAVARGSDLGVSRIGVAIGSVLSTMRAMVADRLVDRERSYRATLLGMRHGVDLVKMIQRVADAAGVVELGGFCARWLEERQPLVERVEQAMGWFAEHPVQAAETPRLLRKVHVGS